LVSHNILRTLSKSKLIAYKQCPKRLWLEVYRPELRDDSGSEMAFKIGHEVGELAQRLFDENGDGNLIDPKEMGWPEAYARTQELLKSGETPIFEATMRIKGALALADVMLPDLSSGPLQWRMIEVKSSTSVKDYHRDDVAVQTHIAQLNGVHLSQAAVAYINTQFVYPGNGEYEGIFEIEDLTEEAKDRFFEVEQWIQSAQETAAEKTEPEIEMGPQCASPFVCGFCAYCSRDSVELEHPTSILPRIQSKKVEDWESRGIAELQDVPASEINQIQRRVRQATLDNEIYFNAEEAAKALSGTVLPAYFLDFETVQFAIPIWRGTRPYEQLPFQFSLHCVDSDGDITHDDFLDLSGEDPREAFIVKLIQSCGDRGSIFVYNAGFEKKVIKDLTTAFPQYADELQALLPRITDLLPVARNHYYHPSQLGSWSLKAVLPAICPELSHGDLEEVQHGMGAVEAYKEAIASNTNTQRKGEIRQQLIQYCKLDTLATVKIWEYFRG